MLHKLLGFGSGGAGLTDKLPAILTELQGLTFSVLTGAGANTSIALAAIRPEDTIIAALSIADAGGLTDVSSGATINSVKATGTVTIGTVVNGNAATVNGIAYTFKTSPVAGVPTDLGVLGTPTDNAAELAAAINTVEGNRPAGAQVKATANAAVVTITATAEGTGGNAITIVGTTNVTASGATLAGGSATGGVKFTAATTAAKVVLVWFNKK